MEHSGVLMDMATRLLDQKQEHFHTMKHLGISESPTLINIKLIPARNMTDSTRIAFAEQQGHVYHKPTEEWNKFCILITRHINAMTGWDTVSFIVKATLKTPLSTLVECYLAATEGRVKP